MEKQINKISEILSKYEKENEALKEKGKFNLQQANYTMKRFAEELGSYFIKELKACSINKANFISGKQNVRKNTLGETSFDDLNCSQDHIPVASQSVQDTKLKKSKIIPSMLTDGEGAYYPDDEPIKTQNLKTTEDKNGS